MKTDWLKDGRKIPDDVMHYIRQMAVYAVRILNMSPAIVAKAYNFNRACIYHWLDMYDANGFEGLRSVRPAGAEPIITEKMDEWLKKIVLGSTPDQNGYDTNLWTCSILVDLLEREFGVTVSDDTVRLHLNKIGLSFQKPEYIEKKRNEDEVERFKTEKFPLIQRLADKLGADIGFEDEAGVGIGTRCGRTWGLKGKTPVVKVSMQRGGYNVLSMVTAKGEMKYSIRKETINGERFIEFLKNLIENRDRPLILLVDNASFHKSKLVKDFVSANRAKLRIFFLPKWAPECNPDEQLWNEIKNNHIGKKPILNMTDLKERLMIALDSVKNKIDRVVKFFRMPDTKYASNIVS